MQTLTSSFDLSNLTMEMQAKGMDFMQVDTFENYVRDCWDKGITVNIDDTLADGHFGSYDPVANSISFGPSAMEDGTALLDTMEHEFMHALQDEKAGLWNSDLETLGLPTSQSAHDIVATNYVGVDAETYALEAEAFTFEQVMTPEFDLLFV